MHLNKNYLLKEWIDGISGDEWVKTWLAEGADLSDPVFLSIQDFFKSLTAQKLHISDLTSANFILTHKKWYLIDCHQLRQNKSKNSLFIKYEKGFISNWLRIKKIPRGLQLFRFYKNSKARVMISIREALHI